jgi:two-component system response regulator FixJ
LCALASSKFEHTDDHRICIVDPNADMVAALEMFLDGLEAQFLTFNDAESYLLEVDTGLAMPDCLIVELALPGMSGLELFETLTSRRIAPPTVVLSSDARVSVAVRAIRAGVIEYFEKPFIEPRLRHVIRNLLYSKHEY